MGRIVILGSGHQARYTIDIFEAGGEHEIAGLLDPFRPAGETVLGYRVLGPYSELPRLLDGGSIDGGFIAIGENWVRRKVHREIRALAPSLPFVSAIHPTATISRRASVGEGTLVMSGAEIGVGCRVERFCLLGTRAVLEHESVMEEFSFLSSGCLTGGCCRLRECAAVMLGATLTDRLTVGAHSIVGAGSLLMEDLPANVVAYGRPARIVRSRGEEEPYLK